MYVPALAYVCEGFCNIEVVASPKLHDQPVTTPLVISVKLTVSGRMPVVGVPEKPATGESSLTVM